MRLIWSAAAVVAFMLAVASCGVAEETGSELGPMGGGGGGGGTLKVTICHIPPGNPANAHTITVGEPAVAAHLAHGDTLGPCDDGGGHDGGGGGGGGGGEDGGCGGGGGGEPDGGTEPSCGLVGSPCAGGAVACCEGLTCVSDSYEPCGSSTFCTCQVIVP